MQVVQNTLLDTTSAGDGAWRNVSNMVAFSIQIIGLEGNVWIEASNDPNILTNGKVGVNISGNLAAGSYSAPVPEFGETQVVIDSHNSAQCMFNPSCLVWNYIRVRKDNTATAKETIAYLFGQNG